MATPLREANANWVYLLADVAMGSGGEIVFTRSANRARTWSPDRALRFYSPETGINGLALAGGSGGNVLVTWGLSSLVGRSAVQVVRSGNYGSNFADAVDAVPDVSADSTALAFGYGETAHLVYLNGKPSYVFSTKAPYTKWSEPIALNDDFFASSYYAPALTVSACGSGRTVLHAVWLDDRAGAGKYNVYYTRKVAKTGELWSSNLRLSGAALPPNYFGYGEELIPAIAAGAGTAVGVWGSAGYYDPPLPAWSSRIALGVSCP